MQEKVNLDRRINLCSNLKVHIHERALEFEHNDMRRHILSNHIFTGHKLGTYQDGVYIPALSTIQKPRKKEEIQFIDSNWKPWESHIIDIQCMIVYYLKLYFILIAAI